MGKVLRIDRPDGRRVHREKVGGPPGRRGAADAAGCVERLWKKVLKIDWPFRARGFKRFRVWWRRLTPQILKSAVLSTILLARPHSEERK